MAKNSYTLKKREGRDLRDRQLYRKSDLESMTTHQLREICRQEKIMHGVMKPLDAEELIHVILRHHGLGDEYLITESVPGGNERLESLFANAILDRSPGQRLDGSAAITVYEGRATAYYDRVTMGYDPAFANTNAIVVSGENEVCGIFNVRPWAPDRDRLYLTRNRELACKESANVKNYSLYCFDAATSEHIKSIYDGEAESLPERLAVHALPILGFSVREPQSLEIPLAIDFGTTNTAAGVYLDGTYFEKAGTRPGARGIEQDAVNYALFYDSTTDAHAESVILPSVVAVRSLEGGEPQYAFGYDAVRLANSIYTDEELTVFYDIKRWVTDFEKQEALSDRHGRHTLVARKDIIKAFFEHVISQAEDRFKCTVPHIHVSSPVKQRHLFRNLLNQILPRYAADMDEFLDEGVTVLYNTISERIAKGKYENGEPQRALIIDCGGGTTDLSSCVFTIEDKRVSYNVELETTYENGDTNFGGNNLTYRIMQLIKIKLASLLGGGTPSERIIQGFDEDTYRFVDEHGLAAVYEGLDRAYDEAGMAIPTRFKDYEGANRADYFKVKSNFYFLFQLAEQVKKAFFNSGGTLLIHLSVNDPEPGDFAHVKMDKWKLSVFKDGKPEVYKEAPDFMLNIHDIERLIKADIYGIVQKFLTPMYDKDALHEFSAIKLSGQSCKIGLFADAIKEFIPGRLIQFRRPSDSISELERLDMKLSCVDGALQYLKDKNYGFANIAVETGEPALPYEITAADHRGRMVTLIRRLSRVRENGAISRNMDDLTLNLYLSDADAEKRCSYTYQCRRDEFKPATYDDVGAAFPHIRQDETDTIIDGEAKFFVWADTGKWGFFVLPITRIAEGLLVGMERFFPFENDSWVVNFFDGTH